MIKRIVVFAAFMIALGIAIAFAIYRGEPKSVTREARSSSPATKNPLHRLEPEEESQTASSIEPRQHVQLSSASGTPVDLEGLTVRAFIDRWSHAARTGDARAAYRVYQAEALCARAAENELSLRDYAPLEGGAERESIEAWTKTLETLCIGTSPAEADERLLFLRQAARSGNANAQIDFFIEGPYGKPYDLRVDDPDPNVLAWKSQAIDFLKQAAMQNNRDALEYLAMAYFNGIVVPQDLETALAYDIALARANNKDPNLALLATQLIKQLPESSVARARAAGETLYRQCCSNRRP